MKRTEDDARAVLTRSQATREKTARLLKKAGARSQAPEGSVDLAAVRASVRRAVVEDEVEKRVAASCDRQAEVEKITRLGRTTLWKLRREDPSFPKPKKPTGGRAIRFRESEVRRWMVQQERKAKIEA